MTSIRVPHARNKLDHLLERAADSDEPIKIIGKRSNGILISEENWRTIQETLHLLSIPEMRESIHRGMKQPLGKCLSEAGW